MKVLILAAGYATRLYPLTKDQPKALLPVAGRPILSRILEEMTVIPDLTEVIIVSNHRFIDHFNRWKRHEASDYPVPVTIVDDFTTTDTDKLGAIGDIQFVLDRIDIREPLLVTAGDNLFTYSILTAWRVFREFEEDMILAQPMDDHEELKRFAVVEVDENMHVTSLEEKPASPRSDLAVYATYFYRADTLPLIRTYLDEGGNPDAPGHFPAWLYRRKPVRVFLFDGMCYDIGTPKAYREVQAIFRHLDDPQDDTADDPRGDASTDARGDAPTERTPS